MPRSRSTEPEFVTAHRARVLTGVSVTRLLSLVARGLVSCNVVPGMYPLFNIGEIRQQMSRSSRRTPLSRRPQEKNEPQTTEGQGAEGGRAMSANHPVRRLRAGADTAGSPSATPAMTRSEQSSAMWFLGNTARSGFRATPRAGKKAQNRAFSGSVPWFVDMNFRILGPTKRLSSLGDR